MPATTTLIRIALALTVGTTLLALAGVASADSAATKITVIVRPDPNVLKIDPDTGDPVKHDPYVLFALRGATAGKRYRVITEQAPTPKTGVRCTGGLNTQAYPVFSGRVVFPLEPVGSGKYFSFAGYEPCRGNYVMNVEERRGSSWISVRSFAFTYPGFKTSYLALRP